LHSSVFKPFESLGAGDFVDEMFVDIEYGGAARTSPSNTVGGLVRSHSFAGISSDDVTVPDLFK
jgi:hypothetical protein